MEAIEEATHRLQDLEERVDFAERMLAKHSDREQLPPMN
jgi:tetrahydromethanopterin S-methyltransferase subunit G